MESGVKRYFMIDKVFFDSLFDLISHYQAGCSSVSYNIVLLFTSRKMSPPRYLISPVLRINAILV
jgi:hypothetical protein